MRHISDIRDKSFDSSKPPDRIVSLVPSITQSIADFGCRAKIVGCTTFCDQPNGLKEELEKTGGLIGGTKSPDIEKIRALNPDFVFANKEENRRADIEKIEEICPVHVSEPRNVDDVAAFLSDLGEILGAESAAEEWLRRIEIARDELNSYRESREIQKYVYLVWWEPAMAAGGDTYISNLMGEGPYANLLSTEKRYPTVQIDDFGGIDGTVIYCSSEPFEFNPEKIALVRSQISNENVSVTGIDGSLCGWHGTATAPALEYLSRMASAIEY